MDDADLGEAGLVRGVVAADEGDVRGRAAVAEVAGDRDLRRALHLERALVLGAGRSPVPRVAVVRRRAVPRPVALVLVPPGVLVAAGRRKQGRRRRADPDGRSDGEPRVAVIDVPAFVVDDLKAVCVVGAPSVSEERSRVARNEASPVVVDRDDNASFRVRLRLDGRVLA